MTQAQINCFLAVAREGSMTRAANRLYISQPAISKSISALEAELGFQLFCRTDKVLTLTYAGNLMYDFFERTGKAYTQLLEHIAKTLRQTPATIKIGCPDTWNPNVFYGRLEAYFSVGYSAECLSIECFPLAELIIRLRTKKLDMIMTHDLYDVAQFGIVSTKIASSRCGIVYSKRHFPNVQTLKDLYPACFLIYDGNIQKRLETLIRNACIPEPEPKIRNCGNQATAIFEMSRGTGVMFFTDWDGIICSGLFGFLPLDITLPVQLMYLSEQTASPVSDFAAQIAGLFSQREENESGGNA